MDAKVKDEISLRRKHGEGYKSIASELGLNLNSVSSYCRRHGLGGYGKDIAAKHGFSVVYGKKHKSNNCKKRCMQCGKLFLPRYNRQKFCSTECFTNFRFYKERALSEFVETIRSGKQVTHMTEWMFILLRDAVLKRAAEEQQPTCKVRVIPRRIL